MEEQRRVAVGDAVVYHDESGKPHNALVNVAWTPPAPGKLPLVNLLFISGDESRQDSYGRQFERASSVSHASAWNAHGRYWRFADEEPIAYTPPSAQ